MHDPGSILIVGGGGVDMLTGRAFESGFWHVLDPGSNPVASGMARLGGFLIGIEIPLI